MSQNKIIKSLFLVIVLCFFALFGGCNDLELTNDYYKEKENWGNVYVVEDGAIIGLTEYGETVDTLYIPSYIAEEKITTISMFAFYKGTMSKVIIENGIERIESGSFTYCNNLQKISIPKSVKYIAEKTFTNSISLENISVDKENGFYKEIEGCLFTQDGTLSQYPVGKKNKSYIIPSFVKEIAPCAFLGCENLKTLHVDNENDYLMEKENNIYSKDGKSLILYLPSNTNTNFDIPTNVEYIKKYSFFGCANIVNIKIPNTVKTIEKYAFMGCKNLVEVEIPESTYYLGEGAFYSCESLSKVKMVDVKGWKVSGRAVDSTVLADTAKMATLMKEKTVIWQKS